MTFKASLLPQADGAGGTSTGQMLGSSTAGWKITKLNLPTTSGGTTYGPGSANQALLSNGSTVYWGTVNSSPTFQYGETLPTTGTSGQVFFQTVAAANDNMIKTTSVSSGTYYVVGVASSGNANPVITNSIYINAATGVLFGAAWNDYAEFRQKDNSIVGIPYGHVVIENGNDTVSLSVERLQPCGQIVSDTYGFIIGKEQNSLPVALCGRVLAYSYEDRNIFKIGDAVCTGPNGTVSKMTREEIQQWPDRILGYVVSIPTYETWGENHIMVDGRIWIKVK